VVVAFGVPRAIFIEAALSFIGVGVDPGTPSWGTMVQEGYGAIFGASHLVIFPSIAIAVVMLAFTVLGDGLRDALDPRLETGGGYVPSTEVEAPRRKEAELPAEERRAA
jgi:oligopeptide transport system permease protein